MNGTLNNYLLYPNGQRFFRDINVTIQAKVNDSCGNNITDANITIRMFSIKTSQTFYCNGTTHVGGGVYNCTFNTSGMPAENYTTIINTSRQYYNPSTDGFNLSLGETSFFIDTAPYLA